VSVKWVAATAVTGALLAAAFAFYAGLAAGGDHAPGREAIIVARGQNPPRSGGAPSPALTDRFSVFRRARSTDDEIGPRAKGALVSHFFTDQAHLAAKLAARSGPGRATDADVFIAGGPNDTVCVLALPPAASGPGGQCTSADMAAAGRDVVTLERGGGMIDIYGVVPDGIHRVTVELAGGARTVLPVADNVYTAALPGATRSVSYDQAGEPVTIPAAS
jgi:hypothetical protein